MVEMDAETRAIWDQATGELAKYDDRAVAATLYKCVCKAIGDMTHPVAIVYALEAAVSSIRESARREQIKELSVPGVQ